MIRHHASYDEKAEEYRREARQCDYRARRDARRAVEFYRTAKITGRVGQDPVQARNWSRIADSFLDSSFRYTARARHCRQLARDYDALAASRQALINAR